MHSSSLLCPQWKKDIVPSDGFANNWSMGQSDIDMYKLSEHTNITCSRGCPRHSLSRAVRKKTKAPRWQGFVQSGRRDLNSGPPVPQTGTLTRLRHAPWSLDSSLRCKSQARSSGMTQWPGTSPFPFAINLESTTVTRGVGALRGPGRRSRAPGPD